MRKLHLVGFTSDRKGLIFSARRGSKSGGFEVNLDDVDTALAAQRRAELGYDQVDHVAAPAEQRHRPESTLTPREMQSRLRAGRSIAEVAKEAQVDPEWVERFAVPILAEQAQMVELARTLTYNKPRRGTSAEPLGVSVAENLIDRGIVLMDDAFDAAWSANQLHDVVWAVHLRYRSRGRDQEAIWEVNVATGQLTSRNRLASTLGYVDERQRRASARKPGMADVEVPEPEPEGLSTRAAPGRRSAKAASSPAKPPRSSRSAKATGAARSTKAARAGRPAKATTSTKPAKAAKARAAKASKAGKAGRVTKATKATKATNVARPSKSAKAARPTKSARPAKATNAAGATRGTRKAAATKTPTKTKAAKARGGRKSAPTRSAGAPAAVVDTPRLRIGTDGSPTSPGSAGMGGPVASGRAPKGTADAVTGPGRAPINRLATTRVAASRAAAGRLSGDRRAANPVPRIVDEPIVSRPIRSSYSAPPPPPRPRAEPVAIPAAAPEPPPPAPEPPPAMADDDHPGNAGGPADPSGLLQFDDILESVDFDDPARAPRPASAPRESPITRLPRPLSAWPMGAG